MGYTSKGMIDIDGQKLKREILKRGLNAGTLSEEMGFERSYLFHTFTENRMRLASIVMLEKLYGIDRKSYERSEEPELEETQYELDLNEQKDFEPGEEFWKKLRMCIYSAVYEAVKTAWDEPYEKK